MVGLNNRSLGSPSLALEAVDGIRLRSYRHGGRAPIARAEHPAWLPRTDRYDGSFPCVLEPFHVATAGTPVRPIHQFVRDLWRYSLGCVRNARAIVTAPHLTDKHRPL